MQVYIHILKHMRLNWNQWSTSLYAIYCHLRCRQRGSTCAHHISLDWIGLDWTCRH